MWSHASHLLTQAPLSKELPERKNTHVCDSVTEMRLVWNSCCSGKKWKVKCCLSSPISLHTLLWCCTNQSWPAVYRIRRLNASRGGPCKCVLRIKPCVWRRTLCNHLLPQWQEMERSMSCSNQRNMLMMSVRDCGDPSYTEVFSSEDGPVCMIHRKSETCKYSLIKDMFFLG